MTDDRRFQMRVSDEWLAMVDLARGGETRSAFLKRLVEGALGGDGGTPAVGPVPGVVKSVRPRAVPAPAVTSAERPEIAARDAARERAGLPPAPRFNVAPSKWSS